jgi:Mlc titration factor MtfA (ptsG expression regulator)
LTETFFELPQRVRDTYPQVYEMFKLFYRQDPLSRMPRA